MVVITGKDDGFTGVLTGGLTDAVFHQITQDRPVGLFVKNLPINIFSIDIKIFGVFTIFFKLVFLLFGQLGILDPFA